MITYKNKELGTQFFLDIDKPIIYLTFDDHPFKNTNKILDILRDFDIKATFFLIGKSINKFYKEACAIRDEKHVIGNHSYDHNRNVAYNDIIKCDIELCQKLEIVTRYFRAPYSIINNDIKKYIKDYDCKLIKWNIDAEDWFNMANYNQERYSMVENKKVFNSDYNLNIIKSNIRKNDIIIMHGYNDLTITLLPKVLRYLKDNGYIFLTVENLI